MLDESKGTLRLARDGLGDERVPCLSLERLKEAYRTGRGSVCSWRATASPANRGNYPAAGGVAAFLPVSLASYQCLKDVAFSAVSKAFQRHWNTPLTTCP